MFNATFAVFQHIAWRNRSGRYLGLKIGWTVTVNKTNQATPLSNLKLPKVKIKEGLWSC